MHIFLDESGQFTKHNHEEYFVVASFTVGEPRRTAKQFRKWVSTRFPKRMRRQAEIKWSATGITDELRLRTLKYISNLDVRIRYIYLPRKNIPKEYRDEQKVLDGLLYANVVGELLDMYLPIADWIAGALARWHENGPLRDECRAILKDNILGEGKELFSATALYD